MKIQCSVCEAAEAKVLCCADEAALCWECDEKVHAANKLANKHQRVPLFTSSSDMPKCDICQEIVGFFFCLEDRALLCRKCDVSIHTANSYVSTHQRFLLTGVRVGLEATEPGASSSSAKSQSEEKMSDTKSSSVSRKVSSIPQSSEYNEVLPIQVGGVGEFPPTKASYGGGSTSGNISQWPIEEFLGLNEFSQNYNYMDNGPSKADSGKLEDSDSPGLRSSEEEMDDDDCLGRVPDSSWTVPQIPSPPTASGLYWPKDLQYSSDSALFAPVPNISFSQIQQFLLGSIPTSNSPFIVENLQNKAAVKGGNVEISHLRLALQHSHFSSRFQRRCNHLVIVEILVAAYDNVLVPPNSESLNLYS